MANRVTIGLLIILLVLAGGFGYYAYTSHQQIDLMRGELNEFQSEYAARAEASHEELLSLKNELQTELASLGAEIGKSIAHTADLESKVGANLDMIDSLENEVGANAASIGTMKQELAETIGPAGSFMNAPDIYREASRAVVRISNGQRTVGSGFVYSPEGHILTAHHVTYQLDEIYAVFPDGRVFQASVVGSCAFSDVAVLELDSVSVFEPPKISDSSAIEIGDPVAAIGSPFDLAESLNTGVVSQVHRFADIEYNDQMRWVSNLIQFDAAVNFGNSGGPLFDSDGGVIGLVIARVEPVEGDGIYYAVSSNKLKRVADSIIANGYFDYPWLGVDISDLTPQQVQDMGLESINGVLVNRVVTDSPADTAGVQVDDIIIAIDGTETENLAMLTSYLGEYTIPGEPATLTVIRGTDTVDLPLEVGQRS
ncbi:MAG: trypsin-like peptidase domain-containing protein [Dehalococcoidales bacterium]